MKAKRCRVCTGGKCKHNGTLCDHGRVLRVCKECGGNLICVHGRRRESAAVARSAAVQRQAGSGICVHGRERRRCKDCRCARAEADTQEKAAAALAAYSRLWPHWRARRRRGSGGVYRVYSGALLVLKVGSLSSLKRARKKGNAGPTRHLSACVPNVSPAPPPALRASGVAPVW